MRVRIPQLGRIVRQFRLERDIGQKEVSANVRYSTRSLRRLEKEGERPERVTLIRILVDGLRIRDMQVINHVLGIAQYAPLLTTDEMRCYGISMEDLAAITTTMPAPEPQKTLWGPNNRKPAGICITSSPTGEFIPWAELKLEIETGLFNQLGRHIPPNCTAFLDDYKDRRNWLVRIIDPEGKQIGYVWFGTNADNNWAYDGLVRVGDDRYVVWQVFQRYSDGSYRRVRMQAPRLQRVGVHS